jgi:hypothetical protein
VSTTKILIVEDERVVVPDLARKMERLDYEVVGNVASAEEAIALAWPRRREDDLPDFHLGQGRPNDYPPWVDTAYRAWPARDNHRRYGTGQSEKLTRRPGPRSGGRRVIPLRAPCVLCGKSFISPRRTRRSTEGDVSAHTNFVIPGMAQGYWPFLSGLTGGSASQEYALGTMESFDCMACSQVISCPV